MSRRSNGKHLARAVSLIVALASGVMAAGEAVPAGSGDVRGLWADHRDPAKRKVAVWIEDCEGQLCGRIYWLRKPLSAGKPKRDHHNPDARLRDRPLCGLRILTGFRREKEGAWNAGQVYNPNDGRTFSSTITLESDSVLRIRGYVGATLFGKTVEWVRPQDNLAVCG